MSRLNEKIMVSKSTLTVTVDHLVDMNFVERHRDKNDRRVVLLKTTSKGKNQLQDLIDERQKFFQESLINDQKKFISLLQNILKTNYNELEYRSCKNVRINNCK